MLQFKHYTVSGIGCHGKHFSCTIAGPDTYDPFPLEDCYEEIIWRAACGLAGGDHWCDCPDELTLDRFSDVDIELFEGTGPSEYRVRQRYSGDYTWVDTEWYPLETQEQRQQVRGMLQERGVTETEILRGTPNEELFIEHMTGRILGVDDVG